MHPGLLRTAVRLSLAAALVAIAAVFGPAGVRAAGEDAAKRVKSCFEGPASRAAARGGDSDDFSRGLAEMVAGKQCEAVAAEIIHACVGRVDAGEGDNGAKDFYPCIGIVANPCMDSEWASNEFREVVCAGTEEKVWLDMLHASLNKLRATLKGERKERLEAMAKAFFDFRNEQCGLVRMLREGHKPDVAYGACTTEAAARFAIDLRDMAATTETGRADGTSEGSSPDEPAKAEDARPGDAKGAELGSMTSPVKADNVAGEYDYLKRLRCPDGRAPSYSRKGSMGIGGYGHIVDLYSVRCEQSGTSHEIYLDMYFPGHVESEPVKGFTMADKQPATKRD